MTTVLTTAPTSDKLDGTGGFHAYINYVNRQPILDEKEEKELLTKYHTEKDIEAARKLVLSHLRFVAYIAKGYLGYGLSYEDLIQEGNIGLMKSVKKYKAEYAVRLATFAVHWIKSEIHNYIINNWKLVKIATTKAQRKLFFKLKSLKQHVNWMTKEETTDIANGLGVPEHEVRLMEQRLFANDYYIIENNETDDSESVPLAFSLEQNLGDTSLNPEQKTIEHIDAQSRRKQIQTVLNQLDMRTRDILVSRWFYPDECKLSLKDLAQQYKISIERVRQIEQAGLQQLRQGIQE
ncbi:RNA polymerase factor sigma-32 [Saccharobesus litoralis]|uniref:RNA polymerase sigma factor n=1 Tax=Saccharobesus litoralis TaxID=2172099 RepID=A0A2S0VN23_9ALTE|nr:RNA polymerase factor sigma-32 [Saccharobesus litoralis]AWB65569.1 RNA polymerase factor sigma-32 [Saccharobesus litoralis]